MAALFLAEKDGFETSSERREHIKAAFEVNTTAQYGRLYFFCKNLLTNSDYCDSIDYGNSPEVTYVKEKLFDSEAKVMEIIWERGPLSAKEISLIAADSIGWNKNTTYTVIKKLEAKGFIRRDEPGFICTPLVSQEEIRKKEATSLLNKVFGGSRKALFSALLEDEELSELEIDELKSLIEKR